MTEAETFDDESIDEEEESDFKEEEEAVVWEDHTTKREEILNSTANLWEDLDDYITSIEIPSQDLPSVEWDDPDSLAAQTAVTIDATKYIYNTKKYRLEYYAIKGEALHNAYLDQYYDIINEQTEALAAVLAEYDEVWQQYLATGLKKNKPLS